MSLSCDQLCDVMGNFWCEAFEKMYFAESPFVAFFRKHEEHKKAILEINQRFARYGAVRLECMRAMRE